MSKFDHSFLCVYGHFSQPPRGNPLTGIVGSETGAAPYQNWNERITEASYKPNAAAGNFRHISFSIGEALMAWLQRREPEIYRAIVESEQGTAQDEYGNALATAYHHSILPLARRRDKRTQVLWGIAAFEHHYGRRPLGFWLPEMAVDEETLSVLADAGIQYTVLARQQIREMPLEGGAGPYKIELSRGRSMGVFVRDDALSIELSFNIYNLGGAGHWARNSLAPRRQFDGTLLLVATEGETFGHHYVGEDQFLRWLVTHEALAVGFRVVSLDRYYSENPPTMAVQIEEPSSWSDQYGLAHWATGQGHTLWKGALRRALDNVASEIDRAYEDLARQHEFAPWELRDQYAPVLLGEMSCGEFMSQHVPSVKGDETQMLEDLLAAQELAQRMYTSYTFTGNDLDNAQPRYAIACAAAALMLAQRATKTNMSERLVSDLRVVTAENTSETGESLLRQIMHDFELDLELAD